MINNEWRSLCAELLNRLDGVYGELLEDGILNLSKEAEELIYRAWDAMDDTKQSNKGLTLKEISDWVYDCRRQTRQAGPRESAYRWTLHVDHEDAMAVACSALYDLGNYVPQPIPISNPPSSKDCDDKGCCWFGNKLSFTNKWEWFYGDSVIYMRSGCTHWLPASTKVLPTIYD